MDGARSNGWQLLWERTRYRGNEFSTTLALIGDKTERKIKKSKCQDVQMYSAIGKDETLLAKAFGKKRTGKCTSDRPRPISERLVRQ